MYRLLFCTALGWGVCVLPTWAQVAGTNQQTDSAQPGSGTAGNAQPGNPLQGNNAQNNNLPGAGIGQPQDAWDPDRLNGSPWFGNDQFRDELGFDQNEYDQLMNNYQQSYQQYDRAVRGLDSNLSASERQQRLGELRGQFFDDFNNRSGRSFTPEQRQRFNQLYMQYRGVNAFNDPLYRDNFNFTPQQQRQLQQLQSQYNQGMNELGRSGIDPGTQQQLYNQLQQQTSQGLQSTLTQQQLQQYQQMTGNPFNFGPNNYFGNSGQSTGATPGTNIGQPGAGQSGSGIGLPNGNATPGSGLGSPGPGQSGSGTSDNSGAGTGGTGGAGAGGTGTGGGTGGAGGGGGSGS